MILIPTGVNQKRIIEKPREGLTEKKSNNSTPPGLFQIKKSKSIKLTENKKEIKCALLFDVYYIYLYLFTCINCIVVCYSFYLFIR